MTVTELTTRMPLREFLHWLALSRIRREEQEQRELDAKCDENYNARRAKGF